MDQINQFGFSYINMHQEQPIRQFSQAARFEEQRQFLSDDDHSSSWDFLQHHDDDQVSFPASVDRMEEYQFVNTFFNIDHYNTSNESLSSPEDNHLQSFTSILNDVNLDFDLDLDPDTCLMPDDNMDDVPMMIQTDYQNHDQIRVNGVDDGLQLVHLLLACAEAVGCRDTQLADSILSQIWYSANPLGDSLQRVSYCFAMGLKSRLSLLHANINANGTVWGGVNLQTEISREDRIEAFHLLHQNTPYIQFGFMAANEAILQAATGKDHVHIVDLGMEHTLQWPSLIRNLGAGQQVKPKFIKITGILGDRGDVSELETDMEALVAEAKSLGIELSFGLMSGPATPEMLTRENLRLKEGETLFVNSILHLHTYVKESRGSLKTILQSIKKLGPTLLTVVEQDANHNGPFFLGRYLESLHYYSAIFDSLEASMGRNSVERMKIERNHFAEEIRNIVAYEGTERVERHERADQWRRQLGRAGFQVVAGMKNWQTTVVKNLNLNLNLKSGDGYTVGYDQKGHVLLGWKGRPIMLAAAWQPSTSSCS
ncbi:GRAS family protein RAD1-like [Rutidosis leptorrhynchoides]|uniref:GRAS family protein RAD1-like n=1 Tax=Rutidosis leptorrhynchoides TaxID=125765 RepID=UPI003A9926B6